MSKITQSAKGMECQIRIPGACNHNSETVVWCHANGLASGKGIGMKSFDLSGAFGCSDCHSIYDRRRKHGYLTYEQVQVCFFEGHLRSLKILIDIGLVKLP